MDHRDGTVKVGYQDPSCTIDGQPILKECILSSDGTFVMKGEHEWNILKLCICILLKCIEVIVFGSL